MGQLNAAATSYPGTLDTVSTLTDGPSGDTIVSAHQNGPGGAIIAIETELGTDPAGSATDVATRLGVAMNQAGAITLATTASTVGVLPLNRGGVGAVVASATIANGNILIGSNSQFTVASLTASGGITILPGSGTLAFGTSGLSLYTLGTAVSSTSGTSIDFTGIPSTAKRINLMLAGVSTNGTSIVQAQIGTAGGVATGNYVSLAGPDGGGGANTLTTGWGLFNTHAATNVMHGVMTFLLQVASTGTWVMTGAIGMAETADTCWLAGSKSLGGTLTTVRLTTVNGSDTFDAGNVNISYEG